MRTLHFRPDSAWIGDIMPCHHEGVYYFYYQCDARRPEPFPNGAPFGWSLATTTDLMTYVDHGQVLAPGDPGGREEWLYAGSVIHAGGCFRAFYTGHCDAWCSPDAPAGEALMFATSEDGIRWTRHPELTITPPPGYQKDFFRDPHVVRTDDGSAWLLIIPARRENGPAVRSGAMLQYSSTDLEHWEFQGELWYPEMYHLLQMPDLFRIGDWWYLLFSEYCDQRKTRYRMSRALGGPWLAPPDDSFDSRCFYAARTVAVGQKRLIVGWMPTRADDLSTWVWGGDAVIHEVTQRADGTLGTVLPRPHHAAHLSVPGLPPSDLTLSRADGCEETVLYDDPGTCFQVTWTFRYGPDTQSFGVRLSFDRASDVGYTFQIDPVQGFITFDKLPMAKWFTYLNNDMQRFMTFAPGREYAARLVVDDDIAVLYIDDVALGARMNERPGPSVTFFVNAGHVECHDIQLSRSVLTDT